MYEYDCTLDSGRTTNVRTYVDSGTTSAETKTTIDYVVWLEVKSGRGMAMQGLNFRARFTRP